MKVDKIVHIYTIDTKERFGGQNILWKKLANHLNNDEFCHYVYDPKLLDIIKISNYFNFKYPNIQTNTGRFERFFSIFNLIYFLILKGNKNHIYHFHDITWRGLLGNSFARFFGFRTIYESVLQGSDTPQALLETKLGFVKLFILRRFSHILCISSALKDDYLNYGFGSNKVSVINNPVDNRIFFPKANNEIDLEFRKKYQIPVFAQIILFVGSVKARKGFHVLVDSFINTYNESNDIFLLVVGPHTQNENPSIDISYVNDCRIKLEKQVPGKYNFVGLVTSELELAKIYRNSDIFVFPSYEEGLGNVVLEAMASKLKIIASNLPVLEGILIDQENCLLFPIGDTENCTKGLKLVLGDNSKSYELFSQNAMDSVNREFSILLWNSNLANLYKATSHPF
jgi:glycosyltransferase involved in cell wall biosynthesis